MKERIRQHHIHDEQNHAPAYWLSILGEEFGEVCRAVQECGGSNYREELIQLAATSVQMAEAYDRKSIPDKEYFQAGKNGAAPLTPVTKQEEPCR